MYRILHSKLFVLFLMLAIFWTSLSLYKILLKKRIINEEIGGLGREIQKMESSNKELAAFLEYLKTESYLEKEAKEKLNLQKPGEKVIIVNRKQGPAPREQVVEDDNLIINEPQPNWRKWFDYFFGKPR